MERLNLYPEMNKQIVDILRLSDDNPMHLYAAQLIDEQSAELAAYKDAEEQGRLVVLPCKVGDIIYHLYDYPHKWEVKQIDIHDNTTVFRCGNAGTDNYTAFHLFELGKTYFLTREEAEAALQANGDTP